MTDVVMWYVVKRSQGHCEIVQDGEIIQDGEPIQRAGKIDSVNPNTEAGDVKAANIKDPILEQWGPYESKQVAIARRVGLIRAGKCQPM